MKKYCCFYVLGIGALLLTTACREEVVPSERLQINIESNIEQFTPVRQTKGIAPQKVLKTAFEEGECMALYALPHKGGTPRQLTYRGGHWTPDLEWKGQEKQRWIAFYPYAEEMSGNVAQRTHTFTLGQDPLVATLEATPETTTQRLTFKHQFAQLSICIKGEEKDKLAQTKVGIRLLNQYVFDTEQMAYQAQGERTAYVLSLDPASETFTAVVPPQLVAPQDITIDGKPLKWNNNTPLTLSGGRSYVLNVSVHANRDKEREYTVDELIERQEWRNKTYWCEGITPIARPQTGLPFLNQRTREVKEGTWYERNYYNLPYQDLLTWKAGCGWYDVLKTNSPGHYIFGSAPDLYDDDRMCWCCSATNLLLWWCNNNRKWIEKYDQRFPPAADDVKRPSFAFTPSKNNTTTCPLFTFMKSRAKNIGGQIPLGIIYFLIGGKRFVARDNSASVYAFKGFFPKVFGDEEDYRQLIKTVGIVGSGQYLDYDTFNRTLKEAFVTHSAIGMDLNLSTPHAVNIWGAEFNAEGNVAYIYYTDNNYNVNGEITDNYNGANGGTKPTNAGLYRGQIVNINGKARIVNPNFSPEKGTLIFRLVLLNLGTKVWEKHLGKTA